MTQPDLTADEARKRLDYDPASGVLRWKTSSCNKVKVGDVAGSLHSKGYVHVWVNWKSYRAHHLIWLMTYGTFPQGKIDHINGVRNDNRLSNLRCVSPRQNQQNLKCHRDGHLVGTTRGTDSKKKPWKARIYINGKLKHLGCFPTQQEAHEAYVNAAKGIQS